MGERSHRCSGGDRAKDSLDAEHTTDKTISFVARSAERAQRNHGRGDEAELNAVGEQEEHIPDGELSKVNEAEASDKDDSRQEIRSTYKQLVKDGLRASSSSEAA